MRIIDLSHPISPDMPLWPGTPQPKFSDLCTIGRDGFGERWLQLSSHTGTHLDAPAHLVEGAASLDGLPANHFAGKGVMLDLREIQNGPVSLARLLTSRARIEQAEFLLLHSGWSRFWGSDEYSRGYPVLSPDAAAWLAGLGLKGIGIDAPSFDPADSEALPIHRALLGAGLVLIENLTALGQLSGSSFLFSALPLPIAGAEACPVRAVALLLRQQ
ncbi:cyclase family protein [Chlorobaculum sp. 24CR]|uniref:cyclase family protein n=1 Tax=Chlorobaculum sp. 24CR TaxID=2508878 RepID=UPI00100A2AEE|nr:cyclase family protein [Chlorobaculum sp. 24CR]RXK87742.1 cyclase family protein [Chlorobaculum sp. 24CR]